MKRKNGHRTSGRAKGRQTGLEMRIGVYQTKKIWKFFYCKFEISNICELIAINKKGRFQKLFLIVIMYG